MVSEIGTQYILLLLAEMKSSCMLRLPYRAQEIVPPEVAAMLPVSQHANVLAIGSEPRPSRRRKRLAGTPDEAGGEATGPTHETTVGVTPRRSAH
jgi:hypothetical protein